MAKYDWQDFLREWSKDLLASEDAEHWGLPPEVIESGWMGFPGATEEQIVAAEARLGTKLPPSYREFLKVSNGWRSTGTFIDRLWSTEEIEWFRVRHQKDWIDAWQQGSHFYGEPEPIPDEEYLNYGDDQTPSFREEYLSTALEISDIGDSAIYLLNPQIVTPDGEWEAWFFASWVPGAQRYRSFWDMMQAEYQSFQHLEAQDSQQIKPGDDPQVKKAKLPGLIHELEAKAHPYRSMVYDSVIRETAEKPLNDGTAGALEDVAGQVRQIDSEIDDPEQALAAVRDLAGRLEAEVRQAHMQQPDIPDIATFLLNPGKMFDSLRDAGRMEGLRQAAATIRWYLNDQPEGLT